jgi:DNA-binding NarL/FixJ family response regulator
MRSIEAKPEKELPLAAHIRIQPYSVRLRAFVSSVFERVGYTTRHAETGEKALSAVREERPSCVLLDVHLPGLTGYQVCRQLREEYGEELPIIFITGVRTDPADPVAGLLLGADDYVLKPFDPDELLARVGRFVRRSSHIHSQHNGRVAPFDLTPREQDVLVLMADGLGTDAIARRLFISPKTVATHIQRILLKLGVHNRTQAVALAHREGLAASASNGAASDKAASPRQDAPR